MFEKRGSEPGIFHTYKNCRILDEPWKALQESEISAKCRFALVKIERDGQTASFWIWNKSVDHLVDFIFDAMVVRCLNKKDPKNAFLLTRDRSEHRQLIFTYLYNQAKDIPFEEIRACSALMDAPGNLHEVSKNIKRLNKESQPFIESLSGWPDRLSWSFYTWEDASSMMREKWNANPDENTFIKDQCFPFPL